jgi:DNA polymerase V
MPRGRGQGALFDRLDSASALARMRAVDRFNQRYGRDTVTFAASGIRRGWKLRSEFISPRYSTNRDEPLTVTDSLPRGML